MNNKILAITIMVAIFGLTACANSENKWSSPEPAKSTDTESTWKQSQQNEDGQKKSTSTYWNESNRY